MKTLVDLQSEIEALKAQASELRAKEFDRTLKEIVTQMRAFGITVAQVRDALKSADKGKGKGKAKTGAKRGRKPKVAAKAPRVKAAGGVRKPAPIKYRGPNGEVWSGRGKLPKWLKAATEAGQSVESFKI